MPSGFKSQAQRQRCQDLVTQGKMTQAEFDKMDQATTGVLPERIGKKDPNAMPASTDDLRKTYQQRFGVKK